MQLDDVGQPVGQAAQLNVAEAVCGGDLRLRHIAAVGVVDPLGHGHQALAGSAVDLLDILNELVHVKIGLGQIDQIRAAAGKARQGGGTGQPAGMPAHNFQNNHRAGLVNVELLPHFGTGGGDVPGGGAKARAVDHRPGF